ncbi:hypothetical protein FKW77_005146 [Venturia effusa]|uniref:Uncharacterized protein n=1 Tax=Venturia effusa TaxID=50376 RepID=A0A517LQC3_9PEZI|nr:hypothetical protein FKW77_005146 [Venturia effusa]
MRVIRGNSIHSYCGARTGFTVANATILQPVGSPNDYNSSSHSNGTSKTASAAAIAGSVLAGIAFFSMPILSYFWWKRRKEGWPSSVRRDRKGDQALTATTPKSSDDWGKDVAMQSMPMARFPEPFKPAPTPFIREVTHFELPTDAPSRSSEPEAGWTELSTKRDSRLPAVEPQEVSDVCDSRLAPAPRPPTVPPKDSPKNRAVSPISPVLSATSGSRSVINDGIIRDEPRTG